MEGNSDGINGNLITDKRLNLVRTESKRSFDNNSESESEPYLDCDDCNDSDDDQDDIDGVIDDNHDDRESLEFEYEPGISLSSLHFYQTCHCQEESESGITIFRGGNNRVNQD